MTKLGILPLMRIVVQYIIGVLLFILIGALPVFLRDLTYDFEGYFITVKSMIIKILTMSDLTYSTFRGEKPLLPIVGDRFLLSMTTLATAFLVALILAFLFSYVIVIFFEKRKDAILGVFEIIQSIPDVVVMFLLQTSIILVYKAYGVKLAQTVSLGSENQAVLIPLISLSLPVFLYLTQLIVLKIFEELDKPYVTFAKSKGLSYVYMLNIHVIRNIIGNLLSHFKTIIWIMLSTLLMVEYIFNLDGLMLFNIKNMSVDLFVFTCILFFTPFFILFRLIELRR
ncbi:ABC transporter permease subunit [Bacillus sp. REN3]|uniref:ABC transporter permease subunit n=1 Tax=Bacillus sp. REN3 TaxID=2802440 RepID=UPI001AEE34EB|nr:ABC transporter permease subunit [Bacillus sp. REN3]